MNQALYRKHRPQSLNEVLGQEHIIEVLEAEIKGGSISHAYLFTGSRGVGKTSVARILAKELETSNSDIYEIDAASNRGIDEVRELREAVNTLPYESQYKVYIIDEVHMLTTPAFNALLKTLEEPPSHVIFILATTEFDKLPETIVSRCEVHNFKQPNLEGLKKFVKDIVKKEGYTIDETSDDLIALLGDGSYRDTLGILQKVLSFSKGKTIKREEVEKITGAPKNELVNQFLESIAKGDLEKGLQVVSSVADLNTDIRMFTKLVLSKVRAVMLLRNAPAMEESLKKDFSTDDFVVIKDLAKGKEINSKVLSILLDAYMKIANSHIAHLPLELALIEILGEGE